MINICERAKKKIPSYGLSVIIQDPDMIELVKFAGYDFARLDGEHVNFDPQILENMFRTARLLDFPLQIRVGSLENLATLLTLEPSAIMFPGVNNVEEAKKIVSIAKFSPLGERGMYAYCRKPRFSKDMSRLQYCEYANANMLTITQIESKEGLENMEQIMQVDGIDMIATGRADLSQALGVPGQTTHPLVDEAENRIINTAIRMGKPPIVAVTSPERLGELQKMGVYAFTFGFDEDLAIKAMRERLEYIKAGEIV